MTTVSEDIIPNSVALELAARMVDASGWARYRFLDRDGSVSLDYAIWQVSRDGAHRLELDQLVKRVLRFPRAPHWDPVNGRVIERRNGCLMRWNDAPGRTRYDVITALTDASRLARKQEKTLDVVDD